MAEKLSMSDGRDRKLKKQIFAQKRVLSKNLVLGDKINNK